MTRLLRLGASGAAAVLLLLGPTACGGDDEGSGDSSGSSDAPDDTAEGAGGDESAQAEPADDEPAEAPAGGVVFVDAVDDPAATVTITEAGFEPADTTVSVGDVVQVTTTDDGIYGVVVGDLSSYTVTTGLDEFFRFDQPGTYAVAEEISQAEATITVE